MKEIKLESETTLTLYNPGEICPFPIPSIPGAKQTHGWIPRRVDETTVVVACSEVDAGNGGFALPLRYMLVEYGLVKGEQYDECVADLTTRIYERDGRIMQLEETIGKLNDKLARVKRYAKK